MSLKEWSQFLARHRRMAVISHVSPDCDAVSATLAMGRLLEQQGKEVVMLNADPIPQKLSFLPGAERILSPEEAEVWGPFEAVITVDAADRERIGEVDHLFAPHVVLANLDHHVTNTRFGHINMVRPQLAASAQVIYELAQELGWTLDKQTATLLYAGLLTDTGGFRFSNTTPEVLRMAADLLQHGIEADRLTRQLLEALTIGHLRLLQQALSNLHLEWNGECAWTSLSREEIAAAKADDEDVEGIVGYTIRLESAEVGLCFREVEGGVKVSLRSKERVDVSAVALALGGGGHARAAGCTVPGNLREVIPQVLERVRGAWVHEG